MTRLTAVIDRIVVVVLGLVLLALGAFALVWWRAAVPELPARLHTSIFDGVTKNWWWPWALAVGGIILVVIALRWLTAHLPLRGMPALRLPGSDASGHMQVASAAIADAAARELAHAPGVRSMKATLVRDRGQSVLAMQGQIEPDTDLHALGTAADAVSRHVLEASARHDLHCRIKLTVHHGS